MAAGLTGEVDGDFAAFPGFRGGHGVVEGVAVAEAVDEVAEFLVGPGGVEHFAAGGGGDFVHTGPVLGFVGVLASGTGDADGEDAGRAAGHPEGEAADDDVEVPEVVDDLLEGGTGFMAAVVGDGEEGAAALDGGVAREGLGGRVDGVAKRSGPGEVELQEALLDCVANEVEVRREGEEQEELVGEGEDGDAVVWAEFGEGGAGAGCDALDAWLHTAADVEEEDEVEGHFFPGEVADGLRLAVVGQEEVLGVKWCGVAGLAGDVDIDADEADAPAEDGWGLLSGEGDRREQPEGRQGLGHTTSIAVEGVGIL